MKAKRTTAVRGADERRRTTRQPARGAQRRSPDAPPRRGRPRATDTAPVTRPQIKPVRPKNASQAKARAKARKAKAPKVIRPPLRERLLARISEIDLNPRTLAARVPFVVLVIGSLGLGLGVTLWLSTDAAERSYQLGSARQTNQALLQQKEALERDVLEAQAAPALAESARELGMIPSRDTAHLVQDPAGNWIVVGSPKPAEGVPPPPLNTPLPDDIPAPPAQAAASRPAPPPVADPREMVVRVPDRAQPAVQAPLPPAQAPAPDPAAAPLAAPLPDSPHGTSGQPPAPGPVEPQAVPLAGPLPGPPAASPPAAPAARRTRRTRRACARRAVQSRHRGRPRRNDVSRGAGQRGRKTPQARPGQERSARARRTRTPDTDTGLRSASFVFRHRAGNAVIFLVLIVAAAQLFNLQVPRAAGLRAEAASQLKVTDVDQAVRGSIVDRNNDKLAFTIEARALTFQPVKIRKQLTDARQTTPEAPDPEVRLRAIAAEVASRLNNKPDAKTVLKKLKSNESFVYLARAVDPAVAEAISKKFPEVGSERQDLRQYPGGSLAANIVGGIDWDGHGLLGLEDSLDATLAGTDGSVTYDRGSDGVVIPGSYRNRHTAVNGSTVQLTLDDDIQFYVQQQVQQAKDASGAGNVSAVVLDAKTGEVLAMSNDNTFDPSQDIGRQQNRELGNPAVSSPFEPGSVNKIVTASSVIEYGLSNPDEVLQVPGSIDMGGVTVGDAWQHGVMPYTTTGVFGKSSNVGTLMLAQRVGPERYAEMLDKFGLGQRANVGLPGESEGLVPPIDQWSGSTFSNLPIGQGLSMTLLQMTGMYQAIANDGMRIPPRIVKATIAPDGTRTPEPRPDGVRVVSPQTAQTVRNMLRAVLQRDPMGTQQGTGSTGAVEGYQLSGKTGTAQKINPACGCYYSDVYWITFAGMVTTDNPRYVIGIMADNPHRTADGQPGTTMAPLFHNIASWLLQRENIPLSPDPGPQLTLQAT